MTDGTNSAGRLLSFVERIERLQQEIKALQADVADIKSEAKGAGFDTKVIGQMLKERRMSADERQEWQALCETYRAALGMLDGTPLGSAARKRFMPPPPGGNDDGAGDDGHAGAVEPDANVQAAPTADDVKAARAQGGLAAQAGEKVTANPYVFDDPRRAAWDEGWCATAGSDGMDLPAAWRRAKPEKGDGKGDGKGAGA